MAVWRQALHVYLRYVQFVLYVVRILNGGRLRVALAERRLLAQHLRQRGVAVLAVARVQPLPEGVHHTNLLFESKAQHHNEHTEANGEWEVFEQKKRKKKFFFWCELDWGVQMCMGCRFWFVGEKERKKKKKKKRREKERKKKYYIQWRRRIWYEGEKKSNLKKDKILAQSNWLECFYSFCMNKILVFSNYTRSSLGPASGSKAGENRFSLAARLHL